MMEPTAEYLAKMELVEPNAENTETVSVRDEARRKFFHEKFHVARNKKFKNASWSIETKATGGQRCNGNIVLIQVGATVPENTATNRAEYDVAPIYILPWAELGTWGLTHLRTYTSEHKGADRISLSEPSRMPVPRFYDYLPKAIFDMKEEVSKKFVDDFKTDNAGLAYENVKVSYILMRCNLALDNRADVEEHTYHTHGMEMSRIKKETIIKSYPK